MSQVRSIMCSALAAVSERSSPANDKHDNNILLIMDTTNNEERPFKIKVTNAAFEQHPAYNCTTRAYSSMSKTQGLGVTHSGYFAQAAGLFHFFCFHYK